MGFQRRLQRLESAARQATEKQITVIEVVHPGGYIVESTRLDGLGSASWQRYMPGQYPIEGAGNGNHPNQIDPT